MYVEDEKCVQGTGWGNLKQRAHLKYRGVEQRIILKYIGK
jgi:hypothetical protein